MSDTFDTLNAVLNARYSCRAFRADPVPETTIRQIVQAAGRAPSWCNAQPWRATITHGAETDRFRALMQNTVATSKPTPDLAWPERYSGVYKDRRRTCGFQLYEAVGVARDDRAARTAQSLRNYALFDAPHVALISTEAELGPNGAVDCGGFVTTFMLAATALGVASVAQASVAAYPDVIRAHFKLPESRLILCAISFGYADADHPANSFRTERADLNEIYDPRGTA
ncbi:MAG: nitroreductase [Roseovarius sp.]